MASTTPDAPKPSLAYELHIEVDLNPKIDVGVGPQGQRYWISFTGGRWTAEWGRGTVEPGGQDSQVVLSDLSAKIDTAYLLKTDDDVPAYICIKTRGWRTGPREVLEALADPAKADTVDPSSYRFRLYIDMETGDERYLFVNTRMWVGSGVRQGAKVIYDAYKIE
ncbi:hypothetical protein AAFC00_004574 [Neodothiora populina]|uniref:Uncharacterized protein n=1 Tax=Neodothiora populina TaxID=2781224 RepID=A0ABR3P3U7_9PEZI